MTMLLGFNLGSKTFLSADTRISKNGEPKADDVQKIDLVIDKGIIILAAGSRAIASKLASAIKKGIIKFPVSKKNFLEKIDYILDEYVNEIISKKGVVYDNVFDSDVILLLQSYYNFEIRLDCLIFKFIIKDGKRNVSIKHSPIPNGHFIKAGAINGKNPIAIDKIPNESLKILESWNGVNLEGYLEATNEIFKVAMLNASSREKDKRIGGKTITLQTFIDHDILKVRSIRGFRSIIHCPKEYQDVSVVTDYDHDARKFIFRDMRSEGMIISNIDYSNRTPVLRYDSCPKNMGGVDKYLRCFSSDNDFLGDDLEL